MTKLRELKPGTSVRITKIDIAENPQVLTPSFAHYTSGVDNGAVSEPLKYWLEGKLVRPLRIHGHVEVDRTCRNGIQCSGQFTSGYIKEINEENQTIITVNSVYKVEILNVPNNTDSTDRLVASSKDGDAQDNQENQALQASV